MQELLVSKAKRKMHYNNIEEIYTSTSYEFVTEAKSVVDDEWTELAKAINENTLPIFFSRLKKLTKLAKVIELSAELMVELEE